MLNTNARDTHTYTIHLFLRKYVCTCVYAYLNTYRSTNNSRFATMCIQTYTHGSQSVKRLASLES